MTHWAPPDAKFTVPKKNSSLFDQAVFGFSCYNTNFQFCLRLRYFIVLLLQPSGIFVLQTEQSRNSPNLCFFSNVVITSHKKPFFKAKMALLLAHLRLFLAVSYGLANVFFKFRRLVFPKNKQNALLLKQPLNARWIAFYLGRKIKFETQRFYRRIVRQVTSWAKKKLTVFYDVPVEGLCIQIKGPMKAPRNRRAFTYKKTLGDMPLSQFRRRIDYFQLIRNNCFGSFSISVWVNQGYYFSLPTQGAGVKKNKHYLSLSNKSFQTGWVILGKPPRKV